MYALSPSLIKSASSQLQSNLNSSNTDGSFTIFELIFESLRNFPASSRKQIFREIFYHEIVCCVYSLESPHRGDSYEYTQHTIIVKEIKNSLNYRCLLPDLAP